MSYVVIKMDEVGAKYAAARLGLIADLFDARDRERGVTDDTEVQDDLRRWAAVLDSAIPVEDAYHKCKGWDASFWLPTPDPQKETT